MNRQTLEEPNSGVPAGTAAENRVPIANGYEEHAFSNQGLGKTGLRESSTLCRGMSISDDVLTTVSSDALSGARLESHEAHLDKNSGSESCLAYESRNGNLFGSISSVDSCDPRESFSERGVLQPALSGESTSRNVCETTAVLFRDKDAAMRCDQTLCPVKVLERISDSMADPEVKTSRQTVVAPSNAADNAVTCAQGTLRYVTKLHSNSSAFGTDLANTVMRDNTTATGSQTDIPIYATSTLATDTRSVVSSISVVMPANSASVPYKDTCVGLAGSSSVAVNSTLIKIEPISSSASLITSMHSSSSASSEAGPSATNESACTSDDRRFEETLFRAKTKLDTPSAVENNSLKAVEDAACVRNPGNLKQRHSDVPVKTEKLCPESLDHESRSCMELSKDSESLKDPPSSDRVKRTEISGDGSSIPSAVSCAEVGRIEANTEGDSDRNHLQDPLSKKRYDRRSVTSISSDSRLETRSELPSMSPGCIVMSQSTEKIVTRPTTSVQFYTGGGIVRSSRSQENYFDSGDITCIDIDLDDNIASSIDALHYDTSSMASLDSMSVPDWPFDGSESDLSLQVEEVEPSRSKPDGMPAVEPLFASSVADDASTKHAPLASVSKTTTSSIVSRSDEPRASTIHGIALSVSASDLEDAFKVLRGDSGSGDGSSNIPDLSDDELKQGVVARKVATEVATMTTMASAQSALVNKDSLLDSWTETKGREDVETASIEASNSRDEMDEEHEDAEQNEDVDFMFRDESFFRQPSKDVDRPSAARLAKRLFYLHGFKKSDVSRHLSKKNSFSQLVGEEYLKYFDFSGEQLDGALRRFMKHITLYGENQDRERLLVHFSCRYQQCNPDSFKSEDCCHTLACALLLLNNDLNGQNIGRKITLVEFISNMADMNDGEQFSKELLKSFYTSIKNQPLEFEAEDASESVVGGSASGSPTLTQTTGQPQGRFISYNPFYEIPDPSNAVEFKKGYVMRKCCLEPDGRKTPLGKRGWKMFYAMLRDMVLHLHIDEHGYKRNQQFASATNSIHIHHSLATKATDYQKKNHVFRLQTADMAQYLIQTSDSKECQEWIDAINFVAASYSAPSSISFIASQKRFQRPLLPSTYTRLNLREQIAHHEKMIAEFDQDLVDHRKNPPEKGAKTRLIQDYCKKENYLKFELKRYKTYCRLLQYKVSTFPELEPSLAEVAIGEVDETSNSPPVDPPFAGHYPKLLPSSMDFSPQSDRLQS